MEQREPHAYSFDADLIEREGVPAIKGKIVKITDVGFLFQMTGTTGLLLGATAKIQFKVPGSDHLIIEKVKVMKSYLRWADPKGGATSATDIKSHVKIQMFEFHFLNLSTHRKSIIASFLDQNLAKE